MGAFGIAFGWLEGAVVVYLREIFYPHGFGFPLIAIPARLAGVEIAREAATLVILAAVAWLAGRCFLERFAAFVFLFGVWDIVYYATLKAVLGWPPSLSTWDVLFLIPAVWTGPVWAPLSVALLFAAGGGFVFATSDRPRRYGRWDWGIEIASAALVTGSFLANARTAEAGGIPARFPSALFGAGVLLGLAGFVRAERRQGAS